MTTLSKVAREPELAARLIIEMARSFLQPLSSWLLGLWRCYGVVQLLDFQHQLPYSQSPPSLQQQPCDPLGLRHWYRLFFSKYVWISYINSSRLNLRQTCTRSSTLNVNCFPTCREPNSSAAASTKGWRAVEPTAVMDSPRSIQLAHPAKEPASKRAARDRASFSFFHCFSPWK